MPKLCTLIYCVSAINYLTHTSLPHTWPDHISIIMGPVLVKLVLYIVNTYAMLFSNPTHSQPTQITPRLPTTVMYNICQGLASIMMQSVYVHEQGRLREEFLAWNYFIRFGLKFLNQIYMETLHPLNSLMFHDMNTYYCLKFFFPLLVFNLVFTCYSDREH